MFEWLISLAMSMWPFLLQILAGAVYQPQPSLPYYGPYTPTAQVSEVNLFMHLTVVQVETEEQCVGSVVH